MDTNAFNELFYRDPYLKEAELLVTHCVQDKKSKLYHIACESTIFYPEGGGQAGDVGFLDDLEVLDTQYADFAGQTLIAHITRQPLELGRKVKAVINWPRRFSFMQNHSGEHILSGLCHKHYGYNNVGFHLGEEEMTLDFDGPLSPEQLDQLLKECNELVWQNVPLETEVMSAEEASSLPYRSKLDLKGPVRLIRIPNGDLCACCGTHVRRTGEIGLILASKLEKWKKGVRITLLCGDRAYRYITEEQKITQSLSRRLSLPSERLEEGIDLLEERLETSREEARKTAEALWEKNIPSDGRRVVSLTLPVFDEHFARLTAKGRSEGLLLIVMPNGRFFLSEDEDKASGIKLLRETFKAKGGGPPQLSQGTLPEPDPAALAEALDADLYEL